MACGISAGDNDDLVTATAIVVLVVVPSILPRRDGLDLVVGERAIGVGPRSTHGDDLLLVGGGVGGDGEDLTLDGVQPADDNGLVDAGVRHVVDKQRLLSWNRARQALGEKPTQTDRWKRADRAHGKEGLGDLAARGYYISFCEEVVRQIAN